MRIARIFDKNGRDRHNCLFLSFTIGGNGASNHKTALCGRIHYRLDYIILTKIMEYESRDGEKNIKSTASFYDLFFNHSSGKLSSCDCLRAYSIEHSIPCYSADNIKRIMRDERLRNEIVAIFGECFVCSRCEHPVLHK